MARLDTSIIPFDFEYYASSLMDYLRLNLPQDYDDFLESNRMRVLIDAIAYEMGLLAYYINAQLKEMFLPTASTRTAMFLLGKLVNYNLQGAAPSQVLLTFSLASPHPYPVPIPALTQVQAPGSPPTVFETQTAVTIAAGSLMAEVMATQGQTLTEVIGVTAPDAKPNQKFLSSRPPLLSTLVVVIDQITWTPVDNLFDAEEGDRVYTAKPNEQGLALIEFGNGVFGAIPPPNETVQVTYRVGGGIETNVINNTVTEILTTLVDSTYSPVSVTVTNAEAAYGGLDPESIEEARTNIPRAVRSMDRFVSREDFQALPQLFSGPEGTVFKSTAAVKYIWAEHLITVFILSDPPEGGQQPTPPSAALCTAVRVYIEERTLPTVGISVESARLQTIALAGTIYYTHNFREESVRLNVESSLRRLFDPTLREIGDGLRMSDLYAAIDSSTGVDYADITTPATNRHALEDEFFLLGAMTFSYVRMPRSAS